jgi:hypothetical protein
MALSKATRLWRRMIASRDAHQCRLSMWYEERPAGASQWINMSAYQESFFIKNCYKIKHILALDTIGHFDDEVILYHRLQLSPSWVDKITSRELLWLTHPHKWEAPRSMAHFQKE